MKTLLLASAAAFVAGAAFSGEVSARPRAPAPSSSWTGCYLGAHAGAGWSSTDFTDASGFLIAPVGQTARVHSSTGLVAGGQVGCDHQFASNWVFGLAGDFSWANIDGQGTDPFFSGKTAGVPLTLRARTDFLGSVTGRVGFNWNDNLIYGKGGVAWIHDKYETNNINCLIFTSCNASAAETQTGWTLGAGVERSVALNWSVLLEYDHYGFASHSLTFIDPAHPTGAAQFGVNPSVDVVKVGVNYRFAGPFR